MFSGCKKSRDSSSSVGVVASFSLCSAVRAGMRQQDWLEIVTPLALDEFSGPRGDFYKNMFAKCPAGRPGTADEVANVAELLMSDKGAFITGSTFLIDGGATASYFYGPLRPEKA